MMRSLFSGVAGLKTHQTRMDVIGNNIANVNTTAYKSQNMVFNDLLYQTTQAASGANGATGRGGINPRQIGLGAKTGAISTAITQQGSAQSTNNPWDIMIEGETFFVVSDGSQNFFTRDGSFTVDGAGNLVMASTGYTVMGWQVDEEGNIRQDVVSALRVMDRRNLTAEPEATSQVFLTGILDKTDTNINSSAGAIRTFTFFDAQGYKYTAKFSFHGTGNEDRFRVQLDDIQDEDGVSLVKKYNLSNINQVATFGSTMPKTTESRYTMDPNTTYDATANRYDVTQALPSILTGYSENPMVTAATDVTVKNPPTEGATVAKDTDITVTGSVTLGRDQLENEPYNLTFNNGKYYTKADSGNQSKEVTDVAAWTAALQKMKGLDTVTPTAVTVDQATGEAKISFDATFKTSKDSNYRNGNFVVSYDAGSTDEQVQKGILSEVFHLEDGDGTSYSIDYIAPDGSAQIVKSENNDGYEIVFDHDTGKFSYIGSQGSDAVTLAFNGSVSSLTGETIELTQFSDMSIDFSSINNYGNGGQCTLEFTPGSKDNTTLGAGRKEGELIGIEVGQDGRITASYDNGLSKLLGQIAVAEFANASGLSKAGNNLYSATMNSGEFDGVGKDITSTGGSMTSGVLEMSNVDLSSEFTTMITTQRGFQANSRIITTSDTLLEELVNLKR